jgi:hypothetical protein
VRKFERGQGATEYLLMLAAVLVIVAIAVYYITTAAGGKPIMVMSAEFEYPENTINIVVTSGTLTPNDWKVRVLRPDDTVFSDWATQTTELSPEESPYQVATLGTSPAEGEWKVQIIHIPSGQAYPDLPVTVSY